MKQKHFVLVHGACHGAWCWYKVVSLLQLAGDKVTALDLAACGVHPKQVKDLYSFSEYFEPLMEFMMSLPPEEKVIIVGHSMGGISVSAAMERFPEKISAAVFAAAFMPGPDLSYLTIREEFDRQVDSYIDPEYFFDDGPNNPPTSVLFGPKCLATKLYQLSPNEDLVLATLCLRPFLTRDVGGTQNIVVTKEKYGSVPRIYIVCDQDKIMTKEMQRWMIKNNPTDEVKGHFVLVHGACHGAWCWYRLATLLKSAGHKVTALDLAASGIHPKQVHEIRSVSDYSEPLTEFMISLPPEDRVILVGHSQGGIVISMAMERFPEKISAGVFVSALMPGPELTFTTVIEEFIRSFDFMDAKYMFDNGPNSPPTSVSFGPDCMSIQLYQLSPPADLMLAMLLIRPNTLYINAAIQSEAVLTKEKYGSVSRIYISCNQDKCYKEDFQRWMIQNNPVDEVMAISDSDHMPMFSRPQDLCSCLEEIAKKYL